MSGWIDQVVACDIDGCDNECSRSCDEPMHGSAAEMLEGLREMAALEPRAWRRLGDRDVCYRHPQVVA